MVDSITHLSEAITALDIDAHNSKPLTEYERSLLRTAIDDSIKELELLKVINGVG